MITVKLVSGLGNQLFQYVVGRQLSIKNNTALKLDISFFDSQNLRSYKLNNYNINATIATGDEVEKFTRIYKQRNLYAKIFLKLENFLPKYYKRYYLESEWWVFEPDLFKIFGNVYLDGYWQHYKYFESINKQIFNELSIKHVDSYQYKSILTLLKREPSSVSLHIRRGDYISDNNASSFMGVMPLSYYNKAIKYILEKKKNSSFYIFSDDLDWTKDNLTINAPVTFVDIENGTKDYLELDLMSKCQHNIIANSTFSWWGAFLNQNSDKIVVAPANWVKPIDTNDRINIQMPDWIKF